MNSADFTASAVTAPNYTAQEINTKQGATNYLTGSTYTFANQTLNVASTPVTFTIENLGNAALGITSIASNNTEFVVSALSPTATAVAGNNSGTFTVTFTPSATGARTATLTITNNDGNEGTYTITLNGTGVAATVSPQINVQQAGTTLVSGTDSYSFAGATVVGSSSSAVTFTIQSTNADPLTVSSILTSGTNGTDFTVSALSPVSPVAGNSSATFTITFTPLAVGARTATLTIASNATNTPSYTFTLNGTGQAPVPALTSATPTGLLIGISSPVVLAGTNLTTATVNFNGGTLTPTSNSATSVTVRITPPAAGPYPVTVTTSGGTSNAVNVSATAPPTGFFEPFEGATQVGYATSAAVLALSSGSWTVLNALSGNPANSDPTNNSLSLRIQTSTATATSGAYMNFDKPNGAGTITVKAARFSADAATLLTVSVSDDAGVTWTAYSASQTVNDAGTLGTYTFVASVAGNIRVRLSNGTITTSPGAPRLDVDDVQITDYSAPAVGDLLVNTTGQSISGTYNNVVIANGGSATVVGNLTVNNAMTVQSGGSLTTGVSVIGGAGTFTLADGATLSIANLAGIAASGATGAVQVAGTRTFGTDASYVYTGGAPQLAGSGLPGRVRNLTVNNSASTFANRTLTLSAATSVAQLLRLQSGSLVTSGNTFTLLSRDGQGSAVVDNTGGVVTGTTTVQRAVDQTPVGTSGNTGYHHYSSPVAATTLPDMDVPGAFANTYNTAYNSAVTPGTTRPFPTVFAYDETRLATSPAVGLDAFSKGWLSPAGTETMPVGKGYSANIPNALVVDFVGTLNNGNVNITGLTRGADAGAGYHLVGNPYPAPLNWDNVVAGRRVGLDGAAYVFNSTGPYSGSYRSRTNGVGGIYGDVRDALIPSAAGFFVRTLAGQTGAINLINTDRVTTFGPQPAFGRSATAARPMLRLALTNAANTVADDAFVYCEAGASLNADANFDAAKLANPSGLNVATTAGNQQLAINGLPVLTNATVLLPLTVAVPAAGAYTFTAAGLSNFGATTVVLRDALTGTRTVLTAGTAYRFTTATTSANGRFVLELNPAAAPLASASQALAALVQVYPNPARGAFHLSVPASAKAATVRLTNAMGQTVLTRSLTSAEADFSTSGLAVGVYTLRLAVDGAAITRKVVVE